jgi:hypothetical protein
MITASARSPVSVLLNLADSLLRAGQEHVFTSTHRASLRSYPFFSKNYQTLIKTVKMDGFK